MLSGRTGPDSLLLPLSLPASRFRRIAGAAALALAAAGLYGFVHAGAFLAREDPLAPADAIFVFAGTLAERPLEAVDLYEEGRAPLMVITRAQEEDAVERVRGRGIALPSTFDIIARMLVDLGVPERAILAPHRVHDNTAEEAQTLSELAATHRWRRVIVVSSKYHLRRVSLASRRALGNRPVEIVVRGSRYDPSVPERWWTRRRDIRTVASEVPKLIAYALGIGA
jgi:uncharacterized SAM-binding protein YcdF (DUF218 family)